MGYLDRIDSPADLRKLPVEALGEVAEELRRFLIASVSRTGGHLASGLGAVELTLALHYAFDTPRDLLVWDVGHQCYPHKVLTGRRDRFSTLRAYGGLSGFLKREESEYDVFNAGHASTSISAALGMAAARDLKGDDHAVVAIIGDGGLTGGMAMEGLNQAGYLGRRLMIILNDNEMSISPNVGAWQGYLNRILHGQPYRRLKDDIEHFLLHIPARRRGDAEARQAGRADGQAAPRPRDPVRGARFQVRRADQRPLAAAAHRDAQAVEGPQAPGARPRRHAQGQGVRAGRGRPGVLARRHAVRDRDRRGQEEVGPAVVHQGVRPDADRAGQAETRGSSRSPRRCPRAPGSTSSPRSTRTASSTSASASSTP